MLIRPLKRIDWPEVLAIYEEGMGTGFATFETELPTWEVWDAQHLPLHRMVIISGNGRVAGWAALIATSPRPVYSGVADVSIYVAASLRGQGLGAQLLSALIISSEAAGIWTLQAGIFPENTASLHLHHSQGFRTVGIRERIGQVDGVWRDVALLERRSPVVFPETDPAADDADAADVPEAS
jgi:phosphinothricin acetyltransferase